MLFHTFLSTGATSFPTASEKKRDTKRNLQCTSVKYRLLGFGIDFIRHGVVQRALVRRFFKSESVQENLVLLMAYPSVARNVLITTTYRLCRGGSWAFVGTVWSATPTKAWL